MFRMTNLHIFGVVGKILAHTYMVFSVVLILKWDYGLRQIQKKVKKNYFGHDGLTFFFWSASKRLFLDQVIFRPCPCPWRRLYSTTALLIVLFILIQSNYRDPSARKMKS
jgi:hypothetical protein